MIDKIDITISHTFHFDIEVNIYRDIRKCISKQTSVLIRTNIYDGIATRTINSNMLSGYTMRTLQRMES